MYLTIDNDGHHYTVKEGKRIIYTIVCTKEDHLASIVVKNIYGEDVMGAYQIKRWFSKIRPHAIHDFTLYINDDKIGELHKCNTGYEATYHDTYYHFIGGEHLGKQCVLCFDKHHQEAEMFIGNNGSLRFRNTAMNAFFSLMNVVIREYIDGKCFPQQAFLDHYDGSYKDTYDGSAS